MAKKIIAMVLVVWLMVAGTEAGDAEDCFDYCYKACPWPSMFCKKWCHLQCDNPVIWRFMTPSNPTTQSLDDDVRPAGKGPKYPVPTEEDYNEWVKSQASDKNPANDKH